MRSPTVRSVGLHALLVAVGALTLAPLAWMLAASFMATGEANTFPPRFLPRHATLEHYVALFTRLDLARNFLNSAIVTVGATVGSVLVSATAGYAFAKLRFPGRDRLFRGLAMALVVPAQVGMLPLFLLLREIGLVNTYVGAIVPYLASIFGIFLVRQYALGVPDELLDSARVDGAGELRIFGTIVVPVLAPILVTLATFTFLSAWNDFMWPLIILTDGAKYTLPVALASLVGEHVQDTELMMAGSVVTVLPAVAVFLVFQRSYVRGILSGSVKGMRAFSRGWLVPLLLGAATARAEDTAPVVVDDFEDASAWSARPADGVGLTLSTSAEPKGSSLRLDFRFTGGGYAVVHRDLALDLPENWMFRFRLRGEAPSNHLEFKLIDASGENVWWNVWRDLEFPSEWRAFSVKKRQVTFAWGPRGGGEIRHVAAIEFAITAGSGGEGTVWLDDLELIPLPREGAPRPPIVATASSARRGRPASAVLDGRATSWMPAPADTAPRLDLDLGILREFGGLDLEWASGRQPRRYAVDRSADGVTWETVREVVDGDGGRDPLFLPESEARFLRLRLQGRDGSAVALREIRVRELEWAASRERFFTGIAAEHRRGTYPRGISGEQSYWTVVGVDRDGQDGLLGEDGALEPGRQRFTVEPFLGHGGDLVTWADARITQALTGGDLPIPSVTWDASPFSLEVLAFGDGEPGVSSLVARYRVTNRSTVARDVSLILALRPFQVNPPAQFLNHPGGTAPVHRIAREGNVVLVDDAPAVLCLTPPTDFAATSFDGGDIVADWLERGALPASVTADDAFGAASAALRFRRRLAPGETAEVALVLPFGPGERAAPAVPDGAAAEWVEARLAACRAGWRAQVSRVRISLPDARVAESLRAQLGWILVNRAGPAIQPGTRAYARSWIRDGALTSSALLRMGHGDAARDFLEWYAPHQYPNGKIPCVVDERGADPVPEHDSSGEFIFLVAECLRYGGGDLALARRMWPRVVAAVDYLDALRHEGIPASATAEEALAFRGILPPSISHEGYSAKPMHSYWDDSWAYRGFRDAAWLAEQLGESGEQSRIAGILAGFGADLARSVEASMRWHGIDYIPGCADLGDFDATSTTIALAPTGAAAILPRAAVERTFQRYWDFFRGRARGATWAAYTPYELRNVGAFVRLGWRERAAAALEFFLEDQRPPAWRQWPEVVWRDARAPRFLGDLPHGWVGSDYVRSVLDMLAYVDDDREALVVGAGVPEAWLEGSGVEVRDLPTPWGPFGFTLRREGASVVATLDGAMRVPPGGILLCPPASSDAESVVRSLPARVVFGS